MRFRTEERGAGPSGLRTAALLPLALPVLATGCESTDPPVFEEGVIVVDATSAADFAYLSLEGEGAIVTPADPSSSTDWQMAFRRFQIRLNGGVSGPGSVEGDNLENNASATAEMVLAFTAEDGVADFEAVTDADISGASFAVDAVVPDPGASWFRFDPARETLVANPGVAWKLRESSDRGFAVFRVVELTMDGQRPLGATVEYRRHGVGGTLGSSVTIAADISRGPAFLNFSEGVPTSPAGCGWDISVTPELSIEINADCDSGTFPLDAAEDFSRVSRADDAPEYAGYLSTIGGAFPASVEDGSGIYWYNLQENSRMWPTYNVFLVRTGGGEVYKVQITGYYNVSGESGHPTVKFRRLR